MTKKIETGKSLLVKGSLLYMWEEIKTLNMVKIRALFRIIKGYLRMKFTQHKKSRNDFSLDGR